MSSSHFRVQSTTKINIGSFLVLVVLDVTDLNEKVECREREKKDNERERERREVRSFPFPFVHEDMRQQNIVR